MLLYFSSLDSLYADTQPAAVSHHKYGTARNVSSPTGLSPAESFLQTAACLHPIIDIHIGGLTIYHLYCICTAAGASDCMCSSLNECLVHQGLHTLSIYTIKISYCQVSSHSFLIINPSLLSHLLKSSD